MTAVEEAIIEANKRNEHNFKSYRPDTDNVVLAHERVRNQSKLLADTLVKLCPSSRELSLALTKLEEVMFWANAAIARKQKENA